MRSTKADLIERGVLMPDGNHTLIQAHPVNGQSMDLDESREKEEEKRVENENEKENDDGNVCNLLNE